MKTGTNEARVDCAGEQGLCHGTNSIGNSVQGFRFPSLFRALPLYPLPPRLLSALQSPNLRFSRDFSASSKMKGSLSNLFQRSSCSLSMETGRLFSGTLVSWNAFFLVSLFFILLLFFFSNTFCPRGKMARRWKFRVLCSAGISIFNCLIRIISSVSLFLGTSIDFPENSKFEFLRKRKNGSRVPWKRTKEFEQHRKQV